MQTKDFIRTSMQAGLSFTAAKELETAMNTPSVTVDTVQAKVDDILFLMSWKRALNITTEYTMIGPDGREYVIDV